LGLFRLGAFFRLGPFRSGAGPRARGQKPTIAHATAVRVKRAASPSSPPQRAFRSDGIIRAEGAQNQNAGANSGRESRSTFAELARAAAPNATPIPTPLPAPNGPKAREPCRP
jgi:hypothetical protein